MKTRTLDKAAVQSLASAAVAKSGGASAAARTLGVSRQAVHLALQGERIALLERICAELGGVPLVRREVWERA